MCKFIFKIKFVKFLDIISSNIFFAPFFFLLLFLPLPYKYTGMLDIATQVSEALSSLVTFLQSLCSLFFRLVVCYSSILKLLILCGGPDSEFFVLFFNSRISMLRF